MSADDDEAYRTKVRQAVLAAIWRRSLTKAFVGSRPSLSSKPCLRRS